MSRFLSHQYLYYKLILLGCIVCGSLKDGFAQKTFTKLPITKRAFNDDTSKLQFAIISDLWGGLRPGIFEDAVDKLELLQPQFVISVGDLIDGKTYNPKEINKQWDEFDAAIKPLSMPFFYVPGNHDIGNAAMEFEWQKRLGSPYYHFVYKNVLFLSINTEDGGRGGIREEQITYFKKVIEENTNVRWTFLFMHRPVWQGKADKQEGYEKIEAFLKGRNYCLFSGHHHTYLSVSKNGQKHYVLASTGGGSDLRGEKFGEFDHVTWVTLTKGEPKVVNLKLDGIIKENIVNEQTHPITETLIDQNWLIPVPFVAEHQQEKSVTVEIVLNNPTNYPLNVLGNLDHPVGNYHCSPERLQFTVAPNSKIIQQVEVSKTDGSLIDLTLLPFVDISLTGEYVYNQVSYSIPATKKLLLSWKLVLPVSEEIKIGGADIYHNIDTSKMINLTNPEYLGGPWYWSGTADAFLRFKMVRDLKFSSIIALVSDDQWVNEQGTEKDMLFLHLEDNEGRQNIISFSPWDNKCTVEGEGKISATDIIINKFFKEGLLLVEFKVPLSKVLKIDKTIRMNIGFRDQDLKPERWVSTMFWKPLWGSAGDYINSGTFLIK